MLSCMLRPLPASASSPRAWRGRAQELERECAFPSAHIFIDCPGTSSVRGPRCGRKTSPFGRACERFPAPMACDLCRTRLQPDMRLVQSDHSAPSRFRIVTTLCRIVLGVCHERERYKQERSLLPRCCAISKWHNACRCHRFEEVSDVLPIRDPAGVCHAANCRTGERPNL